jgi:hypothetical protein
MKRLLIYISMMMTLGIGLSGCYKDIIKPFPRCVGSAF